jgi:transposase-like protein
VRQLSDAFLSITAKLPLPPAVRTEFNADLAATIVQRIADGATLPALCLELGVDRGTVRRWRLAHREFGDAYEFALQARAEALVELMGELCDAALGRGEDKAIAYKRLAALTPVLRNMEWRAMVMNRSRYGQKAELAVTGGLTLGINTKWRGREPLEVEGERAA